MMRRFLSLLCVLCAGAAQAQYSNAADAARAHWDDCVAAAKLAGTALIDQIVDGDLVQGAIVFAQGVLDKGLPLRRARDLKVQDPQGQAFLQVARNTVGAMSSSRLTVCT